MRGIHIVTGSPSIRKLFEGALARLTIGRGEIAEITTDEYFGGCPECGRHDGYFNVRSDHWFKCDKHRTRWLIGANLFSSWRAETESDWVHNREDFGCYREVEPVRPEPTPEEEAAREEWERSDAAMKLVMRLFAFTRKYGDDGDLGEAIGEASALILAPYGARTTDGACFAFGPDDGEPF